MVSGTTIKTAVLFVQYPIDVLDLVRYGMICTACKLMQACKLFPLILNCKCVL